MPNHSLRYELDRESFVPLYIQVSNNLIDFIEENRLPGGFKLPGEAELIQNFEVSRTVIRQALKELEHKNLITRSKGRGTFVAESKIKESLFQELTGFFQDMEAKGLATQSEVLKQEVVLASKKIAGFLEIKPKSPVYQIDRLRFVNREPIVLVTTYLPCLLLPDLIGVDLTHQSLYAVLEKIYGLQIARGKRFLEAVLANDYEANLLQVRTGSPLIALDSVSYLADDTPIEFYHALHRGDRSRFEVDLIRVKDHGELVKKLQNVAETNRDK